MADTELDPYKEPEYRIQKHVTPTHVTFRLFRSETDNVWRRHTVKQWATEAEAKAHAEIYLHGYTQRPTVTRREQS